MIADSFIAGLAGFVAYALALAAALRLWPARPAHLAMTLAVVTYGLALLGAVALGSDISFWSYSGAYGALTLIFLMAFGAIYKSISLRILLDLYNTPGRSARYETLLQRLVRQDSFEARLQVMQRSGFARQDGEHYRLARKGERLARVVRGVQTLFGIERSG